MESTVAENYRYWQESGAGWFSEYNKRKKSALYFHVQELFLTEYAAKHAPAKVLEYGCGVGRHLRNLKDLPGIEAFGYDQSPTMVAEMNHWVLRDCVESHVLVGPPVGRLSFADGEFDIVFTCEVLVHTRPEDLDLVLSELLRVSRRKVLHLEPDQNTVLIAETHNGCWGHDLRAAYERLGKKAVVLPKLYGSQELIEVSLDENAVTAPVFTEVGSAILHRMEEDITPYLNRGVWEEDLSSHAAGPGDGDLDALTNVPEEELKRKFAATSRGRLERAAVYFAGKARELSEALATQAKQVDAQERAHRVLSRQHEMLCEHVQNLASQIPNDGSAAPEGRKSDPLDDLKRIFAALREVFQKHNAAQISLDFEREAARSINLERDRLARQVTNLENNLRYIETRTSFHKMRQLRQSRIASALLTKLRIVSSPVVLEILPEATSLSEGREVWLRWIRPDPEAPALPWSMVSVQDSWQLTASLGCTDDLALLGHSGRIVLPGGRDPVLNFMAHPWSGRVRLGWNGREKIVDLYASETTEVTVRLGEA